MPITEIVRVLARAQTQAGTVELLYDVTGAMLPDEETVGWPSFWLRRIEGGELRETHGPFDTEDDAVDYGESALAATGWGPA